MRQGHTFHILSIFIIPLMASKEVKGDCNSEFEHMLPNGRVVDRVVITGMGMITPVGKSTEATWNAVVQGKSGIAPITLVPPEELEGLPKIAGEVKDFKPKDHGVAGKNVKFMARFIQFAVAAGKEALQNAGIDLKSINTERVGISIGSSQGGFPEIENMVTATIAKGLTRVPLESIKTAIDNAQSGHLTDGDVEVLMKLSKSLGHDVVGPTFLPSVLPNLAPGHFAIALGLDGAHIYCPSAACATGAASLRDAVRAIQYGETDVMLGGGTEAVISPGVLAGFNALDALSKSDDPARVPRPFDLHRDGFVIGEGAAVLLFESRRHAKARSAVIIAEIAGHAQVFGGDVTKPGKGPELAMAAALKNANMSPTDIDHLNAHGTATDTGDLAEAKAIRTVFGSHATGGALTVSADKSKTGHLLSAAGAVEAGISALTIQHGIVTPTMNHDDPIKSVTEFGVTTDVSGIDYVPHQARKKEVRTVMSNSLGFGGFNTVIILKKDEGP